jgi:hypothetical protein
MEQGKGMNRIEKRSGNNIERKRKRKGLEKKPAQQTDEMRKRRTSRPPY